MKKLLVAAIGLLIVSGSAQAETFYAACYRSHMRVLTSPEAVAAVRGFGGDKESHLALSRSIAEPYCKCLAKGIPGIGMPGSDYTEVDVEVFEYHFQPDLAKSCRDRG